MSGRRLVYGRLGGVWDGGLRVGCGLCDFSRLFFELGLAGGRRVREPGRGPLLKFLHAQYAVADVRLPARPGGVCGAILQGDSVPQSASVLGALHAANP